MRERRIENYFVEQVMLLGGEAQKIDVRGHRGRTDRFAVFHRGPAHIFYFVELKRDGGPLKPWQEREHARLRARDYDVRVLYSIEDVDAFILEVRKRLR